MNKKTFWGSLIGIFFASIICHAEIPLPPNWTVNVGEPTSSMSTCTSCGAASKGKSLVEVPVILDNGSVAIDIDLATVTVVENLLLKVQIGTKSQFSPSTVYQITEKKSDDDAFLIVKIGGAKIPFKTSLAKLESTAVFSGEFPEYSISRNANKIVVKDNDTEYRFSCGKDSILRLTEIRKGNGETRNICCEYDNDGLMTAIMLPNKHKYEIYYQNRNPIKVSDPAGTLTEILWQNDRITGVKTSLTATYPFYSKENIQCNIIRNIEVKYDNQGRILNVINSNGEKISAEYRNERISDGNSLLTTLIFPDGAAKFTRVTINNSDSTQTIESGYIGISPKYGVKTFIAEEKVILKKTSAGYMTVSKTDAGKEMKFSYDENSKKKISETDALGRTTRYKYDKCGRKIAEIYPDDSTVTFKYDDKGQLVEAIKDGIATRKIYREELLIGVNVGGLMTTYEYDEANKPSKTLMPDGTFYSFEWDELSRIISYKKPDGVKVKYSYAGFLDKITEIKVISSTGTTSYSKHFEYDAKGRLTQIIYPDSTSESFVYGCCNLIKYKDRTGTVISYVYDAGHRKVLEISPNNEKTSFAYNTRNKLIKVTYPNKTTEENEYDKFGRLVKYVKTDGNWEKYAYDAVGDRISMTNSNGSKSLYAYDSRNRMISVSGNAERNFKAVYNKAGMLIENYDYGLPAADSARKTSYSYNTFGRMCKILFPDNSIKEIHYLSNGRLDYTLKHDIITKYTYDQYGRIVSSSLIPSPEYIAACTQTEKDALIAKYKIESRGYDVFGNLYEVRGKSGLLLARYNHTPDGELQSLIRPTTERSATKETYVYVSKNGIKESAIYLKNLEWNPATTSHDYNESLLLDKIATSGNIVKSETLGKLVSRSATKADRILWEEDCFGNKTRYNYEPGSGLLLSLERNGEITTSYQYDSYSRVKETTDILGRTTQRILDRNGRMTTSVLPDGSKSEFIYDEFGHLRAQRGAGAYPINCCYNAFGELVSYTDGNGSITRFEYDPLGRIIKRIWPNGSTISYIYDSAGRLNSKSEAGRNTSFLYDGLGRLIEEKVVCGNDIYTRKMSYDEAGRLIAVNDENGIIRFEYDKFGYKVAEKGITGELKISYDSKGRLASTETRFRGSRESFITEYNYDEFDRIVKVKSSSGEFNYTWAQNGKLASQSIGNSKIINTYDKIGRLTSKMIGNTLLASYEYDLLDRRIAGQYFDAQWRYSYDQINQLIGGDSADDKYRYEYDAIGNRLKVEVNEKKETYAYNNLNQISSLGYVYDKWGNILKTPEAQYVYDLKNRLVKVSKNDGTIINYAYDAMDQRISSTVNGENKTEFLMSDMVEYARKQDNAVLYHTLGLDLAGSLYGTGSIGAVLSTGDIAYLYDGNGNVIGAMQDDKITHKLAYEPFGKQITNVHLPFTFGTKNIDLSNMSYYGFRFYDPIRGWLNRDPIEEEGGLNFYSFVMNNTVNEFDVLGLTCKTCCNGYTYNSSEYCCCKDHKDQPNSNGATKIARAAKATGVKYYCTYSRWYYIPLQRPWSVFTQTFLQHCWLRYGTKAYGAYPQRDGGVKKEQDKYTLKESTLTAHEISLSPCSYNITKFKSCIDSKMLGDPNFNWNLYNNCRDWVIDTIDACKDQSKGECGE